MRMQTAYPGDNKLAAAAFAAGLTLEEVRPIRARRPNAWFSDGIDRPPRIPDPLPPVWDAGPNAKLLLDLEPGDCRFPVGEGEGVHQLFCAGEAHISGEPYCEECNRRVARSGATVNPRVAA